MQLNDAKLAAFKRVLEADRDRLTAEIDRQLKDLVEPGRLDSVVEVKDRGDESVSDLYTDLAMSGVGQHVRRLEAVRAAIERMENRRFGICVDCSGALGIDRLQADPAASRCIDCQRALENVPSAKDVTPSL